MTQIINQSRQQPFNAINSSNQYKNNAPSLNTQSLKQSKLNLKNKKTTSSVNRS